mmetsp:Transcript_22835/g.31632  ORF Transcript_22835/g.31632 Transcript_22835/m.31632 type:complete len:242 (-) Transcript_22835:566-1291(-)
MHSCRRSSTVSQKVSSGRPGTRGGQKKNGRPKSRAGRLGVARDLVRVLELLCVHHQVGVLRCAGHLRPEHHRQRRGLAPAALQLARLGPHHPGPRSTRHKGRAEGLVGHHNVALVDLDVTLAVDLKLLADAAGLHGAKVDVLGGRLLGPVHIPLFLLLVARHEGVLVVICGTHLLLALCKLKLVDGCILGALQVHLVSIVLQLLAAHLHPISTLQVNIHHALFLELVSIASGARTPCIPLP